MGDAEPHRPLRVVTPRLELRSPSDDELRVLAALSAEEIHDPARMPFSIPWTRVEGDERVRNSLEYWADERASATPEKWTLTFMVVDGGLPVGAQSLITEGFPATRSVETASWLVRRAHGRGIGREMRAAALHLAFAGLGAVEARSASFVDNPASRRVSEVCGYEHAGTKVVEREGVPVTQDQWLLTRARWKERRRDDITIEALDDAWLARLGVQKGR
jgi:RimJ/RimL family protein N-acetyltransferase